MSDATIALLLGTAFGWMLGIILGTEIRERQCARESLKPEPLQAAWWRGVRKKAKKAVSGEIS